MDQSVPQSTLREVQAFLGSPRFWTTFTVIVLIFAVTGPFGTLESMRLWPRIGYWLLIQAVAWSFAISFAIVADIVLHNQVRSKFGRMMIGSLLAAMPIGLALGLVDNIQMGSPLTVKTWLDHTLPAAPLCALFCVLAYMTMHRSAAPAPLIAAGIQAPNGVAAIPPILRRLRQENRGSLLRLSVSDHYTEVVTGRGRELILLRFADAVGETTGIPGTRVHRSHWIADAHVKALKRDNGRLSIVAADGTEIPVSRPYAGEVRRRFG